jgi:O-antigen/teichoic acid export membrane protein/GT2 family glycosyltransferase
MTTFSVVIAAFEAEATIGQAVESVLGQTRADFEVIVVDDGSADRTAAVARAIALEDRRVLVQVQENAGPSHARNRGIAAARGSYVSMLDSDDLWLPNYLEEMGGALEREPPDVGFAYTDAWVLDECSGHFQKATTAMRRRHPPAPTLPPNRFVEELLARNFVFNSVTVRRTVLERVGGYDAHLTHAEDYELWLRIVNSGFRAVRVPGPLAVWRDRPGSLSEGDLAMEDGLRSVYRAVIERHPASPRVKQLAQARLDAIDRSQARASSRRRRARSLLRARLAAATRERRLRWRRRPAPPPSVAQAFPGLGTGKRSEYEGGRVIYAARAASRDHDIATPTAGRERASRGDGSVEAGPPEAESGATPTSSLTGVVARGIGLAGAGYLVSQLLTFVAYLALARLLTPTDFGHFAAGTVVVGFGAVLGESGMLAALIQRRNELEPALNSAFVATAAGSVALTLAALALAPLIGLFFHSYEAGLVAAVMCGSMLLRLLAIVPDSVLQRRFSFMRRVVVDPLSTVAFAVGSITAALFGLGVWALVIGTYAAGVLTALSVWLFAGWRPRPRMARIRTWRELARFGRPVVTANLIRRGVQEIPVLVIGRLVGSAALGQFTYAWRAASQPLGAVINAGGYVLLPAFSRLSADERRFRAAVRRALQWLCIAAFPTGLLFVPLGVPAMVLVFGAQWREAGYGAMALGPYCAALSLDSIASEAWKASGRTDMLARMHSLSALLTLACVLALAPFGLVGVTIGMSISAIGVAVYAVRGMGYALGIALRDLLAEIWPPALAAITMAGIMYCFQHFLLQPERYGTVVGLALLVLEAVLGVLIYLLLLALLAPTPAREILFAARNMAMRLGGRRSPEPSGA